MYWAYTRSRVLTLEFLDGMQLADVPFAQLEPEQRRRLAHLITEAWMAMIFKHGFFHADPHPANILLTGDQEIGLVDFGLVGKLSEDDVSKATRLFIDVANENVDALPAGCTTSASAIRRSRRTSSPTSCASSTTATTGRASPRSTRSW